MRIFLTGTTGFVGRALSHFLTEQGHKVLGLVHDVELDIFNSLPNPPFSFDFGDVRNFKRMREILFDYKPDAILHLAAQAIVTQAHLDPYTTFDVNVGGTISLLSAFREACPDAWFLYFSTDKVYGNGLAKKESDPVQASGVYETSKAAADLIARHYFREQYPVCVTRCANIYGPGDRNNRIIPNTVRTCLQNRNPVAYEGGPEKEYVYIADLCQMLQYLISSRALGTWNLGSDAIKTNIAVVSEVLKYFPNLKPEIRKYGREKELESQSIDWTPFQISFPDFTPVGFEEGIRRTVEWWKQETQSYLPKPLITNA